MPIDDHDVTRRQILADHRDEIQRCVDAHAGAIERLPLTIVLAAGRVTDVKLIGREVPILERCIEDELRGVQLPADPSTHRLRFTYKLRSL